MRASVLQIWSRDGVKLEKYTIASLMCSIECTRLFLLLLLEWDEFAMIVLLAN